jgi:hypothetical protein
MARCWAFSRARGAPSTPEAIAKSRYAYSCDRQRTMLAPSAGSLPIAALSVFEVANRDAGRQLYESHVGLTHRSRRGHALRFVALQVAEIAARLPRSPAATFGRWRQGDTALLPLEQDGERGVSAAPPAPQDLRDRADECERWAASAIRAEDRKALLYLAKRWRALADEDEAMGKVS